MEDRMENIENILQNLIELYFDHKYESICNILKIEHNLDYTNNNKPVYKYDKNEGMIFYKNKNPLIDKRVKVDEETKYILGTLLMITSNLMSKKDIIDLVIDKWIKNVHLTGLLNHNEILNVVGNETRIHIEVSKNSWDNLSKACKNKNISIKTGLKTSLMNYFREICNNNTK